MSDTSTIAAQRHMGRERLKACSLRPSQDIESLLTDLLELSRTDLFIHSERKLTNAQRASLEQSLTRLEQGEPIAYVRGQEEFWSLSLAVTPNVLIPRPDTERLVELALERLSPLSCARVLELGTGSGAIALALATERETDHIVATDLSTEAITVARSNYQQLKNDNPKAAEVTFVVSDWFQQLTRQPFDLIVSNPPYIDETDPDVDLSVVRYEPTLALFAKEHGMAAIKHVIANSAPYLKASGTLMFEHGWKQHASVQKCFKNYGFNSVRSHKDFGGHYRVTEATITELTTTHSRERTDYD